MVALLREFPALKVTFNLVPSLLVQLEAFAREEARGSASRARAEAGRRAHRTTSARSASSTSSTRTAPRMIDPYPRYAELLERRGASGAGLSARRRRRSSPPTTCATCRCGTSSSGSTRSTPSATSACGRSSRRGAASPKRTSRRCAQSSSSSCGRSSPSIAAAAERGQVELSTSPFYHPILPLLCDTRRLPAHASALADAARAVPPSRGRRRAARPRGRAARASVRPPPAGLWPSEGSVSDAMVPLVGEAGFAWMATDEEILARSLGGAFTRDGDGHVDQPDMLYRPYRVGARRARRWRAGSAITRCPT